MSQREDESPLEYADRLRFMRRQYDHFCGDAPLSDSDVIKKFINGSADYLSDNRQISTVRQNLSAS